MYKPKELFKKMSVKSFKSKKLVCVCLGLPNSKQTLQKCDGLCPD